MTILVSLSHNPSVNLSLIWAKGAINCIKTFVLPFSSNHKSTTSTVEVDQNQNFLAGTRNLPGMRFPVLVPGFEDDITIASVSIFK